MIAATDTPSSVDFWVLNRDAGADQPRREPRQRSGGSIEQKYAAEIPELALGAKISEQSPVELKNWLARKVADLVVSDERYVTHKRLHSDAKIEFFYKSIVLLFFCWFVATLLFAGVLVDQHSFRKPIEVAPSHRSALTGRTTCAQVLPQRAAIAHFHGDKSENRFRDTNVDTATATH